MKGRVKVGIVGAGRMAGALMDALASLTSDSHQYQLTGISSRTKAKAQQLADRYDCPIIPIDELAQGCQILFILTNDGAISQVAQQIAQNIDQNIDPQIAQQVAQEDLKFAIHCSGALNSKELEPLRLLGLQVASLHPLRSLAGGNAVASLRNCWYTLEGDPAAVMEMSKLVEGLDGQLLLINGEQKTYYHAAACIVSNYLATLMDMGLSMFQEAGFTEAQGRQALWPLIEGTLANIQHMGAGPALTGPISRGDWQTVAGHLEAMDQIQWPYRQLYRTMGSYTAKLAWEQGTIAREEKELLENIIRGQTGEGSSGDEG